MTAVSPGDSKPYGVASASMKHATHRPLIVWQFTDGKLGHEKQTLGLVQALSRQTSVSSYHLRAMRGIRQWVDLLARRFPQGDQLPAPDILVATGHATHIALLAARRSRGGKAVVLMKPSLPTMCFDLCLIPEHDQPTPTVNVIMTRGVLNNVIPVAKKDSRTGLILVGGPSPHFVWRQNEIRVQIIELVRLHPEIRWELTTSRRTPCDFLETLELQGLSCFTPANTAMGWLEQRLARVETAWVTPDSVSMVYEALSAGCRVGVFDLPAVAGSRVARGVQNLVTEGWVALPGSTPPLARPDRTFNEADRCAGLILGRWFQ